jgi:hypothetical protein
MLDGVPGHLSRLSTCLSRITAESVRQYVVERKAGNLSNRTMNLEVSYLARVLRRAKRWHLIADGIRPLPEGRDIGRVLTPEQKMKLLKISPLIVMPGKRFWSLEKQKNAIRGSLRLAGMFSHTRKVAPNL